MPKMNCPANVNQHVCAIRLDQAAQSDAGFLVAVIESSIGQNQILKFNAGGNREGLNYEQVKSFVIPWPEVEERYEKFGLTPAAPSQASRVHVPLYLGDKQIGKATSTTWSPILKKMIALASVETAHSQIGTKLQLEITIEAMHQKVTAKIVKIPFFNPERKTATPV